MAAYGYVRISSADQNENRQMDSMEELKIPMNRIYLDKVSGKDFKRASYQQLVRRLKSGDVLYIKSIDRLGRNYVEILDQWRILTKEKGIDIAVLDMLPLLDTRNGKDLMGTFLADIVLAVLSMVAQKEHEFIRTRQAEGIIAAKARGVRFGRTVKKTPENFADVVKLFDCGKITLKEALRQTDLKQATFYRRLREFRTTKRKK